MMFLKFDLGTATTTTSVKELSSTANEAESPDVNRVKITPQPRLRSSGQTSIHTHFGGFLLPRAGTDNIMDEEAYHKLTHIHAIIGASILGCILLVVVSCVLVQYCKNKRRQQREHSSSPTTGGNASLDLAHSGEHHRQPRLSQEDGYAEDNVDTPALPLRGSTNSSRNSSRSSSENELSRLTRNFPDGTQPVRYCFIDDHSQSSQASPTPNTATSLVASPADRCTPTSPTTTSPKNRVAISPEISLPVFDTSSPTATSPPKEKWTPSPTETSAVQAASKSTAQACFAGRHETVGYRTRIHAGDGTPSVLDNVSLTPTTTVHYLPPTPTASGMFSTPYIYEITCEYKDNSRPKDTCTNTNVRLSSSPASDTQIIKEKLTAKYISLDSDTKDMDIDAHLIHLNSTQNLSKENPQGGYTFSVGSRSGEICAPYGQQQYLTPPSFMEEQFEIHSHGNCEEHADENKNSSDLKQIAVAFDTISAKDSHALPETDTESEVSEFLASLVLDVSPSDATDGEDVDHQGHSDTDEESAHSDESLLHSMDVKAQAEFSPYHLAWSTPYMSEYGLPQANFMRPPKAAKRLDIEFLVPGPPAPKFPPQPAAEQLDTEAEDHGIPDDSRRQSDDETSWLNGCEINARMSSFSSLLRSFGLADSSGRKTREDVHTSSSQRPFSFPRSSNTIQSDAATWGGNRENENTLPHSVSEYRRSLKGVAKTKASSSTASPEIHSEWSSSSSPPSHMYTSSLQPKILISKTPLATRRRSTGSEQCEAAEKLYNPPRTPYNVLAGRANSTMADLEDLTDSSEIHGGEAVVSHPRLYCMSVYAIGSNNSSGSSDVISSESMATSSITSSPLFTESTQYHVSEGLHVTSSSDKSHIDAFSETFSSEATSDLISDNTKSLGYDSPYNLSPQKPTLEKRAQLIPIGRQGYGDDHFKVPLPVDNSLMPGHFCRRSMTSQGSNGNGCSSGSLIPRSRSATAKPLYQYATESDPCQATPASSLRKSRTSDEISPYLQQGLTTPMLQPPDLVTLMSVGSTGNVSVTSTSASRLSLLWDHEFTAPGRGANDSLAWEDDPCLDNE